MRSLSIRRKFLFFLLIFFCFNLLAVQEVKAQWDVKISFLSEVEVLSERMYLGEIAYFEGREELIEELKKVDLGPSPVPGGSFYLAKELIFSVLRYRGYDLEKIECTDLGESVLIKRAFQNLDRERVLDEVYSYVYQHLSDITGSIEINLRREIADVKLPIGEYSLKVNSKYVPRLTGNITVPVSIFFEEKEYMRIPVSLEVKVFARVFVALRAIERSTIITEDMVTEKVMEIPSHIGEPLFTIEDIVGKEVKRTIKEGTIIVGDYLMEPQLIKKNDRIIIEAVYGAIRVQALGKALESGGKGDWIWVENISSGQKVEAQVIDTGLARVRVI